MKIYTKSRQTQSTPLVRPSYALGLNYIWRMDNGDWTLYRTTPAMPGASMPPVRMGWIITTNGTYQADRHPVYCHATDSSNEYVGGTHKTLSAAMREVESTCIRS